MRFQLTITMDDAGNIGIEGPVDQKMVCYGLLECARDAIKDHCDRAFANRSPIAIAGPGDIPDRSKDRHVSFDAPLRTV
jgi:hypothetical protein